MPPPLVELRKLAGLKPDPTAAPDVAVDVPRTLRRRLEPALVSEIVAKYRDGATTPALCVEYSLSKGGLLKLLRDESVQLRYQPLTAEQVKEAAQMYLGLMESFWSTMQRELLDQHAWQSRDELGQAIFEWIEAWYNPRRRHSGIGDVSPLEFENTHHAAIAA